MKPFLYKAASPILALLVLLLPGCGEKKKESTATDFKGYPVQSETVLEYWMPLNPGVSSVTDNMGKTPFAQQLQKETGVKIKYIHPTIGTEQEAFRVMLASRRLPDIIETNWQQQAGGVTKAVIEEQILPLNGILEKYSPNFWSYLQSHPDIDRASQTTTGQYALYPFVRGSELLKVYYGPILRKDWLDRLGLSIPQTIDEWHAMLTAFKKEFGATAPLSFTQDAPRLGAFTGAFSVKQDFYRDGSTIKYGPMEPGYRQYLETMAQWYEEGLLDKNIAGVSEKVLDNNILSEKTGATVGYNGAGIGKWMDMKRGSITGFELTAAPYPVRNKGDKVQFGYKDESYSAGGNAAISTSCRDVELAARFLDYGYTQEGSLLYNFGIEGESYTMENGEATYTNQVLHDEALTIDQSLGRYVRATYSGPFVQDGRYMEQYMQYPQQQAAYGIWNSEGEKANLPLLEIDPLKTTEVSAIMADVNSYVDEASMKFIMGVTPFSQYDTFLQTLRSYNIGRVIEIYNEALKEVQTP